MLYATPLALLTELRAAGETNAIRERARSVPARALFPAALARLPAEHSRVTVTLRMAVMTGRAPDWRRAEHTARRPLCQSARSR